MKLIKSYKQSSFVSSLFRILFFGLVMWSSVAHSIGILFFECRYYAGQTPNMSGPVAVALGGRAE